MQAVIKRQETWPLCYLLPLMCSQKIDLISHFFACVHTHWLRVTRILNMHIIVTTYRENFIKKWQHWPKLLNKWLTSFCLHINVSRVAFFLHPKWWRCWKAKPFCQTGNGFKQPDFCSFGVKLKSRCSSLWQAPQPRGNHRNPCHIGQHVTGSINRDVRQGLGQLRLTCSDNWYATLA